LNNFIEQIGICFERLGDRTQRRFARSTASCIRKVFSRDAVLATAGLAATEDGHKHLPNHILAV
jgi:hypothetical protein